MLLYRFTVHITATKTDSATPILYRLSFLRKANDSARSDMITEYGTFASFDPAKKYSATKNSAALGIVGRLLQGLSVKGIEVQNIARVAEHK